MTQQGDVLFFLTTDGGDITVEGGVVDMAGGLETAVTLSLFGGNEDDDGRADSPDQWWGNLGEERERQYRSETQHLLRSLPAVSSNLRRLEDAAVRDLAWMTATGAASDVSVAVSLPALNRVRIAVSVDGRPPLVFSANWRADAA